MFLEELQLIDQRLDKPVVFAFPELMTCLDCGFVEFVLADPVIEQLRKGVAQLGAA
jgi:hypothetical protein